MPASAYLLEIGPSPVCGPADHATALAYLCAIQRCFTPALKRRWRVPELARLRELERTWRARAYGCDPRFEVIGTRNGRLDEETEAAIYQVKRDRLHNASHVPLSPRQRRHLATLAGQARARLWTRQDQQRHGRLGGLATQAQKRAQNSQGDASA